MLGQRLERNDLGVDAVALPILDGAKPSPATHLKNVYRHDDAEIAHADVHPTVAHGIVGHFSDERWQVTSHSTLPTVSPEQRSKGRGTRRGVKFDTETTLRLRRADSERPTNSGLAA